jgi:hypothetical protein
VSEAGIVVAKPRIRWRVPVQIDAAKARPGSTCRWKALWAVDVAPFDEGAAEPALALRPLGSMIWTPAPTRDRERQRSVASLAYG